MSKKIMKAAGTVLLAAAIAAACVLALLGVKRLFQNVHKNVNDSRREVLSSVEGLENTVNALEAQMKLANPGLNQNVELNYDWLEENLLIAHALGGLTLDGYTNEYTNSLEAFRQNYEKGIRVFEADLLLSSDGVLVAVHEWREFGRKEPMSYLEFQEAEFYEGRATQLSGGDIIDLLVEYPDIYLITDTKYTDVNSYRLQFSQLVYLAQQKGAMEVLDRIIVQIYNQGMFDLVYEIYPWKSVVYTLYQSPDELEDVRAFCRDRGIRAVTMAWGGATEEAVAGLKEAGISVLTYTVNDPDEARRELNLGVSGFYTDAMAPGDLG